MKQLYKVQNDLKSHRTQLVEGLISQRNQSFKKANITRKFMCDRLNFSVWYTSWLIQNLQNHSKFSLNLVKFFMAIRDISIKLKSDQEDSFQLCDFFPLCDVIHAPVFFNKAWTSQGPIKYVWDFKSIYRKLEYLSASRTKKKSYLHINVTKLEGRSSEGIWRYNSTFNLCIFFTQLIFVLLHQI